MLQNEQCKLVLGLFPTINYTLIVLREPTKWLLIVNVALSPVDNTDHGFGLGRSECIVPTYSYE